MQPSRMHCPHCSIVLRIRDRKHVGRQVDCPDCGKPIQVLADGPLKLQLAAAPLQSSGGGSAAPTTTTAVATQSPVATQQSSATSALQHWMSTLTSATGIAWSVAAICGVVIVILAAPFQSDEMGTPTAKVTDGTNEAETVSPPNKEIASKIRRQQPPPTVGLKPRLEHLGGLVMEFVEDHERFPASSTAAPGMTEEQRLSWLAELAADFDASSQPLWDQSWRDPLNDRFVRRTLAEFQNPNIDQPTGPDRYPATHFVGIAGVGADAPRLPVTHRRAGIFGVGRRTRIADIKDGQANTMMIAGVTKNFGRWAGSGLSTMRPLTAEPYIGGPDGFGTQEEQGMSVLMADGSVRFLSKETDPRIFRRMAAIADGFPLDPKVPGEPGEQPAATRPNPPKDPLAKVDPQLPDKPAPEDNAWLKEPPVIAPVPPRIIDVAALLAQPILEFEQSKATPLRVVLLEVEEMIGVPIRYDEKLLATDANEIAKSIRVKKLKNTTVGEILMALVEEAGLAFEIEKNSIRVKQQ